MSISLHQATAPVLVQMLGSLDALCDKAEAYCAERKVDPATLLGCRLYPNMFTLQRQIQVACEWARNTVGRIAGVDVPKAPDEEMTFAALKERIAVATAFVKSVDPAAVDAGADKEVTWKAGPNTRAMQGADFALHQALPQFFFHVTTAYAILRHNGVELAKRDFMGDVPRMKTL